MDELTFKPATELARMLAAGDISCPELTDHFLGRIKQLNNRLNAFTYVADKRARLAAKQWQRSKRSPETPLSGVPVAMKDMALVRMMPVGFGSAGVGLKFSPIDDKMTKAVRGSGAIIVGKTSTSELGALPVTSPDTHPPTVCPFNTKYTAGGSSGGAGASVAAGMIPIAHGGDGGGSIRIPAAINHLVGLKATRGALLHTQPVDKKLRLISMGPLARTIEDMAAFLDLMTEWPQDFYKHFDTPPSRKLKIAMALDNPLHDPLPEYKKATQRIADALRELGHEVVERKWISLGTEDFLVLWKRIIANAPFINRDKLQPVTRWLHREGQTIPPHKAVEMRISLEHQILDWFGDFDVWLSPALAMHPVDANDWQKDDPAETFDSIVGMGAYTATFNVSGQPALVLPAGMLPTGVPIGVQLAGQPGKDLLLLQLGRSLEKTLGDFSAIPKL